MTGSSQFMVVQTS